MQYGKLFLQWGKAFLWGVKYLCDHQQSIRSCKDVCPVLHLVLSMGVGLAASCKTLCGTGTPSQWAQKWTFPHVWMLGLPPPIKAAFPEGADKTCWGWWWDEMFAQHQAQTPVSLMAAQRAVAALLSGELEHLLCVPRRDKICAYSRQFCWWFCLLVWKLVHKSKGERFSGEISVLIKTSEIRFGQYLL